MINCISVVLTAVCALALPTTIACVPGTTLAEAGARAGRDIGVLVERARLSDPVYEDIVNEEFHSILPAHLTEISSLQPTEGNFNFDPIDFMVRYAETNGKQIRASRLINHNALPLWLVNHSSRDALRKTLHHHITTVLTHLKGRVRTWDVVQEAYMDGTDQIRPTLFQRIIGSSYIEEAFTAARAADPDAELCYADYYIEDIDRPKTRGVYNMVKDFKARGIPIDCVAIESHFDTHNSVPANFQHTIEAFAALGVNVHLSELDVSVPADRLATEYRKAIKACLAVSRCTSITIYGVRDKDSWRSSNQPLLFDNDGKKKPAYYAALDELNQFPVKACR